MNCVEKQLLASLLTGPVPALGVGEIPYFMLPAYRHFGHGMFHEHTVKGRFDIDRMCGELGWRRSTTDHRLNPPSSIPGP
jgi:hypothetical protein